MQLLSNTYILIFMPPTAIFMSHARTYLHSVSLEYCWHCLCWGSIFHHFEESGKRSKGQWINKTITNGTWILFTIYITVFITILQLTMHEPYHISSWPLWYMFSWSTIATLKLDTGPHLHNHLGHFGGYWTSSRHALTWSIITPVISILFIW